MRKLFILGLVFLWGLILIGCQNTEAPVAENNIAETAAPTEPEAPASEEPFVSVPDLMMFSSLEEFNDYLVSSGEQEDIANLSNLDRYYLPVGLPEEYQIYKITPGTEDIGFWYLPEQYHRPPGAMLDAEAQQKNFLFLMLRNSYDPKTVLAQLDGVENLIAWEEAGTVLMLYLPAEFEVTDLEQLCHVEEYVRNKDSHVFEVVQDS